MFYLVVYADRPFVFISVIFPFKFLRALAIRKKHIPVRFLVREPRNSHNKSELIRARIRVATTESNYYLLIFTGGNGACSPRRDRMLNNMGTFYKRLSIGYGWNWKNTYVGRRAAILQNNVFQKYCAAFVSCLRRRGQRENAKEKGLQGGEKRAAWSA